MTKDISLRKKFRLKKKGLELSTLFYKKHYGSQFSRLDTAIKAIHPDAEKTPAVDTVHRYFQEGVSYHYFKMIWDTLSSHEFPVPAWDEIAEEIEKPSAATDSARPASPQFSTYEPQTFAGRDAEIAKLSTALSEDRRILVITGVTGVGKTALVERVIADLMDAAENTLPYHGCRLDSLDAFNFLTGGIKLLEVLKEEVNQEQQKIYEQDPAQLLPRLLHSLESTPCRLQIDSLECLFKENEKKGWTEFADPLWLKFFKQVLTSDDFHSQLLLTSQNMPAELERIGFRFESRWHWQKLQGLKPDEQKTLFQKRDLPQDAESLDILQHLGAFFDGHPLVLNLIAAEIKEDYESRVTDYWKVHQAEFTETPTPTTNPVTGSSDSNSLFNRRAQVYVEQTLLRLPEHARQMFCASAVFRRPVPPAFWQAMLTNDSENVFGILKSRHLVESDGAKLVYQHNMVHPIAYKLLKSDLATWHNAERQAAHLWLTAYIPAPDASNLETVRGCLEAFEHYCKVEDWELASKIYTCRSEFTEQALNSQLLIWGFYKELLDVSQKLVDEITSQTKTRCLNQIGNSYRNLGSIEKSIDYYQQALQFSREIGDRHGESESLCNLGIAYYNLGSHTRAIDYQQQCLTLAREIDDRQNKGDALDSLGLVYNSLGSYEEAIKHHQEALGIYREIGDHQGQGSSLGGLGVAYYNLGQYTQAINYQMQHLKLAQKIGDPRGKGNSLGNLGVVYYALGRYTQALKYQIQHLRLARKIGDRKGEADSLDNLGLVENRRGNYEQAIEYHKEALKISREISDRNGEGYSLHNLGIAYALSGQYEHVINIFQERLTIAIEIGDRRGEAYALSCLGGTYSNIRNYEQAIERYKEAIDITREIGDQNGEGQALHGLGHVQIRAGQYPEGLENLRKALNIFRELNTQADEANVLRDLAKLHQELGEIEVAKHYCKQALALAIKLDIPLQEECQKLKEDLENGK